MSRRSRVVYTDASVRGGWSGIAVVADWFARSRRVAGDDATAAELRAVLYALEIFPRGPLIIVCDSSTVRNGASKLPRNRRHGYGGPNCAKLWGEFDKRAAGRRLAFIPPKEKNSGLHGRAHHLARAAAQPENLDT